MEKRKLVIIGSGPAAHTAALYGARANLQPLLFEGFMSGPVGGQLMTTTHVENYPGFPDGILGPDLMKNFRDQSEKFGTKIISEDVERVDLSQKPFLIEGSATKILGHTLIIATGAMAKRLDIEGTRDGEFWQKGVTACAVCDGAAPIFRNKPLFVIGGGDSAVEEATFLTNFSDQVFIVHRRGELRASKIMAERALRNPKLKVLWNSVIEKVTGDTIVRKVIIRDVAANKVYEKEAGGVFFAVGHVPNTAFLKGQLELNPTGYIIVKNGSMKTSVEGVFAAGDVQDPHYRQAVTAAGTGCMAALDAEHFIHEKGIE